LNINGLSMSIGLHVRTWLDQLDQEDRVMIFDQSVHTSILLFMNFSMKDITKLLAIQNKYYSIYTSKLLVQNTLNYYLIK